MNSKILNLNNFNSSSQVKNAVMRCLYSASNKLNIHLTDRRHGQNRLVLISVKNNPNLCRVTQLRWTLRGGPGYTKFGHGRLKVKRSKFAYFWYTLLGSLFLFAVFFDFEAALFRGREPKMRVEEIRQWYSRDSITKGKENDSSSDMSDVKDEEESDKKGVEVADNEENHTSKKKEKVTFRDSKIIKYENRIRQFSTPDKIFRYFATLSVWNEKTDEYEIYMTPEDFVRSLTYGAKQPENLGLDRYTRFDPQMQKLETNISEDSIFRHLNKHGLISFTDYIFLLTLLSTPTRHFEIAFHMFDLDGSGHIDLYEFEHLQVIIRNQTSSGQRHRDTHMTGSVIRENPHLNEYFFGRNLDQLLTVEKFVSFQKQLQAEVVRMEFELCPLKTNSDGEKVMSEHTFCEQILAYAGFNTSKTKKMLKKISSIYQAENSKGITLKDYEEFFQVLRSIHDIDTALKFYSIAGASIEKGIVKHVSKTVAGVNLTDHLIDVIFNLFDENDDGKLSHKEFIQVMKKRWMRGLQQPKDTGFIKLVEAVTSCTRELVF